MTSVCISAWSFSKFTGKTDMWVRQREDDIACDGVLCRWRSHGYFPQARSLFHAAQTEPALRRGKHQSVPGLKAKSSPPPSQQCCSPTCGHGHGHACKLHICSNAYKIMLLHTQACTGLASFSFTHRIVCVYSCRPHCWYHLVLSQLHQPTPCLPQQELFFFFLYACTVPSVTCLL